MGVGGGEGEDMLGKEEVEPEIGGNVLGGDGCFKMGEIWI